MTQLIQKYQNQLHDLVKSQNIAYLGLFGSYARGEEDSSSDVDLLIKFNEPGGLLRRAKVKLMLEAILQKPVDLVSQKSLSPKLKPFIEQELIEIYPHKQS